MLQAELNSITTVVGVSTQGRFLSVHNQHQWVTEYTIMCSIDGVTFTTVYDEDGNVSGINLLYSNAEAKHFPERSIRLCS